MFKAKINQFSSIQCKATHKWILIIILWAIKETTHSHPNIYSLIRIFEQWASWKITTKTVYVTKCPIKVKHSLAINFAVSLHLCSVLEKNHDTRYGNYVYANTLSYLITQCEFTSAFIFLRLIYRISSRPWLCGALALTCWWIRKKGA